MNKENIKIGNVRIENYDTIMIKFVLEFCIFTLIGVLALLNVLLLPFFLIYSIFFLYLATVEQQIFSINDTTITIHYTTNVDFDEYTINNLDWLDSIKKYYENETVYEKQQKYKISKKRFLYYSNARDAKDWLDKQNEELKNLKLNQF